MEEQVCLLYSVGTTWLPHHLPPSPLECVINYFNLQLHSGLRCQEHFQAIQMDKMVKEIDQDGNESCRGYDRMYTYTHNWWRVRWSDCMLSVSFGWVECQTCLTESDTRLSVSLAASRVVFHLDCLLITKATITTPTRILTMISAHVNTDGTAIIISKWSSDACSGHRTELLPAWPNMYCSFPLVSCRQHRQDAK